MRTATGRAASSSRAGRTRARAPRPVPFRRPAEAPTSPAHHLHVLHGAGGRDLRRRHQARRSRSAWSWRTSTDAVRGRQKTLLSITPSPDTPAGSGRAGGHVRPSTPTWAGRTARTCSPRSSTRRDGDSTSPACRWTACTTSLNDVALRGDRRLRRRAAARRGARHRSGSGCRCARCAGWPPPRRRWPSCRSNPARSRCPAGCRTPTRQPRPARSGSRSTGCSGTCETALRRRAAERGAAAPVRRRRQPRAAHPAGRHPRLRRAGPAAPGRLPRDRDPRARPGAVGVHPDERARRRPAAARPA